MKIGAIILTLNEAHHLPRCLDSLRGVVDHILLIDCFSKDGTVQIAEARGIRILQRAWTNYANQFNWALTQLDTDTDWVLRIDADEYLTTELANNLSRCLAHTGNDIDGITVYRRMTFQRQMIRFGGIFPIRVVRVFRYGKGECENRWMDEHIKVNGSTVHVEGELIDDNLNSLTWWTDKHNKYASREAVDLLNLEFGFIPHDSVAQFRGGSQAGFKRWLKERVYARLPGGFRAFAYFFYRYVIRLGFLDGRAGTAFHFLQGFWYRYLVDAKVSEVKRYMRDHKVGITKAIDVVLGIKV